MNYNNATSLSSFKLGTRILFNDITEFKGMQGYQGITGITGEGVQGFQGFQGTTGSIGPQGLVGMGFTIFASTDSYTGLHNIIATGGNIGKFALVLGGDIFTYLGTGAGSTGPGNSYFYAGDLLDESKLFGFQGYQGYQGHTGLQGHRGHTGLQGYQGHTGLQGLQGYQGHTGFQGYQGYQGHTGLQGYQGYQGHTGLQGYQGYQGQAGMGFIVFASTNSYTGLNLVIATGGNIGQFVLVLGGDLFVYSGTGVGTTGPGNSYGYAGDVTDESKLFGFQGYQGYQGHTGLQGLQGYQGHTGLQGLQGYQGHTGLQGLQGYQGETGMQGYQGYQGHTGLQGLQGYQGHTGLQGYQGYQGHTGLQGYQGYQGHTGLQGLQGYQGHTGLQGYQGHTGLQGYQGYQGHTGLQGLQGYQGHTGLQGFQGYQGHTGLQGYQGYQGHTGLQGLQGYQGHTGLQGLQGYQGPVGMGFIVFASTNSYTGLNLVIATGGNIGQFALILGGDLFVYSGTGVGTTGPGNSYGYAGDVTDESKLIGLQGVQGYQGHTGLQGYQGHTGLQGFQGHTGLQGFQGYQGHTGLQGFQGYQGHTGLQGFQGYQGLAGTGTFTITNFGNFRIVVSTGSASVATAYSSLTFDGTYLTAPNFTGTSVYASSQHLGNQNDTITVPSYSWNGDTTTGFYHASAGNIGFTTNGSEKMRISSAGNVGIGNSNPQYNMSVSGVSPTIELLSTQGPYSTGSATLLFNTTTASNPLAKIVGFGQGTSPGAYQGAMSFFSQINTTLYECMRITGQQAILMGTTTLATYNGNTQIPTLTLGTTTNGGLNQPGGFLNVQGMNPLIATTAYPPASNINRPILLMNRPGTNYGAIGVNDSAGGSAGVWIGDYTILGSTGGTANVNLFAQYGGNVGIGTGSPGYKLDVNGGTVAIGNRFLGTHNASDLFWFGLRGTNASESNRLFMGAETLNIADGLVNNLRFLTNGSERMRIDVNGNVGIGTTAPILKLHISESTTTPTSTYLKVTNASNQSLGAIFGQDSGNNVLVYNQANANMLFATNNTERMRIDSNGNVGIGTTAPITPLNVIVTTNGGILTQDPTNASKNSIEVRLRDTNTSANYIRCDQYSDVYNTGAYQATRFIVRQSGNVGIGTANPGSLLDVNGTSTFRNNMSLTGASITTTNGSIYVESRSNDAFAQSVRFSKARPGGVTSGNELGYFYFGGNDSTNTNRNGALIMSRSEGTWSSTSAPAYITFETATGGSVTVSERMRITSAGNVGIGTTTPAGTLHVNGTLIDKHYDMGTISATNLITLDLSLGTIFTLNYTNGSYIVLTCTNAPVSGSQTVTIYVKSNAAVQFAGAGSNVVWGTPGVPTLTLNKVDCFEISYVPAFGGGSAQYYAFRKGYGY